MKFEISECSCGTILIKQSYSDIPPQEITENVSTFNQVEIKTCILSEIGILSVSLAYDKRIDISFQTIDHLLVCYFVLSGTISSENVAKPGKFHVFSKGRHNLYKLPPSIIYSSAEQPFEMILVCFSEKFVQKLFLDNPDIFGTITKSSQTRLSIPAPALAITPAMIKIIQEITLSDYRNYLKRIFTEAKVLELLFNQLEQINNQHDYAGKTFKKYDIDKIHHAKKLIEENLQNPCSLIELAHKVGINDFKLKKGFKEILGNTVFGYLFDLRMEKAHKLLMERKSVSEVAYEVGYKNPHHFTSAFKKKFGLLPSELNK